MYKKIKLKIGQVAYKIMLWSMEMSQKDFIYGMILLQRQHDDEEKYGKSTKG